MGWIKDLSTRLNFYSNWIENGTPKVTWFSGLFFTQSFITGTLQNYARRQHVPIDECGFDFEVVHPSNGTAETITTSPEHGSYITGLFLEATTGMSTNFVINIRLSMSSKHEQAHWIKRGVALLCQLNE